MATNPGIPTDLPSDPPVPTPSDLPPPEPSDYPEPGSEPLTEGP